MKKYIILASVLLIGVLQSCDSELEETNPNFITTDGYFDDLNASESILTSVYAGMLDEFVVGTEFESLRTDLAYPGPRRNNVRLYLEWHQQRVTENTTELSRLWDSKYKVIWRANQVIEGLNSMTADLKADEKWTEQMGQARFFRGLMHFYLHSTFNEGEIIIRDFVPVNEEDFSLPVSTSDEVKTFFRADLEYAYQNLPAQMDEKSRVDGGAAATILGTSYLYDGDYENALRYFGDIVNNVNGNYGYALEQNMDLMFTNAGGFNSESILEINYSTNFQLEDSNFDEESFFHRLARRSAPPGRNAVTREAFGALGWLLPSAWLTYEYSNEPMNTQDPRNFIGGDITGTMRNLPLRASQTLAVVNDETSNYYGSTAPQVFAFNNTRFSLFKKYTNHDIVTNEFETGTIGWKSGRNVVINRLSGVYLMYAESLIQTGDVMGALTYINDIRRRWGLQLLGLADGSPNDFDGVAYDSATLMEHLMFKEYPMELAFEGFASRFIDLRRWGISAQRYQQLSTETYSLADYTYIAPNGNENTRNGSLIQKGSDGSDAFTEYSEAANSWSSNAPAYYPLPQSEILYNPNTSN